MKIVLILLAFCSVAVAQQPEPATLAQACQGKLLETIQGELNIRAQAISWQRELIDARARIKELEAKIPKSEEKK